MTNNIIIDGYLHQIGKDLEIEDAKFEELRNQYDLLSKYIYNNHILADGV